MVHKAKRSFWDAPEWYTRWRDSRSFTCLALAAWFLCGAVTVWHRRWAEAYAIASPVTAAGIAYLIGGLPGARGASGSGPRRPVPATTDRVNCLTLLVSVPAVGLVGVALFGGQMLQSKASLLLLAATFAAAAWLLAALAGALVLRFRRSRRPPSFEFESADGRVHRLGRTRLLKRLETGLQEYEGAFVIVERDPASLSKSGQYVFYEPRDLLEDSYPESDVKVVEELLQVLLPAARDAGNAAVMIPAASVKDIGTFDDEPLLREDPSRIAGRPMSVQSLLTYLDQVTSAYDSAGYEFRMTAPKGAAGIYLWHNYV